MISTRSAVARATMMLLTMSMLSALPAWGQEAFVPPGSERATFNFNVDWKFLKMDAPGSEEAGFDDSKWQMVSTPHTWNDVDSFDEKIARGGEGSLYMGQATYRKHFKLPAELKGKKIFLEFEGIRQAAKFFLNGKPVGKHENGVTAFGLDLTEAARFGEEENVLTVKITNVTNYKEEATDTVFQWESRDFNPNYGGIQRNVRLVATPKLYQTLPLLDGLGTTGTYVYATDIDVAKKSATVTVESQVRNETGDQRAPELSVVVVGPDGKVAAKFKGEEPYDMVGGETGVMKASAKVEGLALWSPETPSLYSVYSMLTLGGKVVDCRVVRTGFRKTEFKGGAGTGGVFINDKFTYLKGYAQRSVNEWAAVGGAYPDWMADYDMKLARESNANYMRWMHIAAKPQMVAACDAQGIVEICPAGDKEANPTDAKQWQQRVAVMRATMVYHRNSPSILFWEAGNNAISADRLQQMVDLRKELDPSGGRAMGTRHGDNNDLARGDTHISEYYGVMIAQDKGTEALKDATTIFRGFSNERRDLAPFIETEDFRDEALRRYWDDFSPPAFGFKKGANDTYAWNSETFCLEAAKRYWAYWSHRISLTDPALARWSAYASIIWADSNQHGRLPDSAVCRVSGKVDAVRIRKEAFYTYRVMQNEKADSHIIGHWNYPSGTKKTMYVVANHVDAVELILNGKSLGKVSTPADGFVYAFPDVMFVPGKLEAVGTTGGKEVTRSELVTAGPMAGIKLTPYTKEGGLVADGADVAFFDVEAVDAQGRRCPLEESRIDFKVEGPAIWRGGVNEYIPNSTNNTYLLLEAGINRVFIRATRSAGTITLTATREGLAPAKVTINAKTFEVKEGLAG